jgi:hypothetical protein
VKSKLTLLIITQSATIKFKYMNLSKQMSRNDNYLNTQEQRLDKKHTHMKKICYHERHIIIRQKWNLHLTIIFQKQIFVTVMKYAQKPLHLVHFNSFVKL